MHINQTIVDANVYFPNSSILVILCPYQLLVWSSMTSLYKDCHVLRKSIVLLHSNSLMYTMSCNQYTASNKILTVRIVKYILCFFHFRISNCILFPAPSTSHLFTYVFFMIIRSEKSPSFCIHSAISLQSMHCKRLNPCGQVCLNYMVCFFHFTMLLNSFITSYIIYLQYMPLQVANPRGRSIHIFCLFYRKAIHTYLPKQFQ